MSTKDLSAVFVDTTVEVDLDLDVDLDLEREGPDGEVDSPASGPDQVTRKPRQESVGVAEQEESR